MSHPDAASALTSVLRATLIAAMASVLCLQAPAEAAPLPGDVELGMAESAIRETVKNVQRVRRPAHLTGGLVGGWSASPVEIAGQAFEATFFFHKDRLQRVEYLALAAPGSSVFDAMLQWARQRWGSEMRSTGPEGDYAAWNDEEVDAYLQDARGAKGSTIRFVVKPRVLKDGSEL